MVRIDLNADLGETVAGVPPADDEAMFAVVSSASIACGGHAGDAASVREAVDRAVRHGVAIGAHPSYPDPEGFGRVRVMLDPAVLTASIAAQLSVLEKAGAGIRYVKPHGALYHAVTVDAGEARVLAQTVADLSERIGRPVPILGFGGAIAAAAESAGLPFHREAFLDRGYLPDGRLVPRTRAGAVLDDPSLVAERAIRFVRDGVVESVDGTIVRVEATSLCVHGDSPAAVAMARAVRMAFDEARIEVRALW